MASDLDLIVTRAATVFVLSDSGQILHKNNPEKEPGPRLYISGCEAGNVVRLGHEVDQAAADQIARLVEREPPLHAPDSKPIHLDSYLNLLSTDTYDPGLNWMFPDIVSFEHPAPMVKSGTAEAEALVARLDDQGMPETLSSLGFLDTDEFWQPWCAALGDDGEIASIAFTVGTRPSSAEVGVTTIVDARGQGMAAAAVAEWASHPELDGRTLFYSTSQSNTSSQRVTQRLGLRYLGASLTIV